MTTHIKGSAEWITQGLLALAAIGFCGSLFFAFIAGASPPGSRRSLALGLPLLLMVAIVAAGMLRRRGSNILALLPLTVSALVGLCFLSFIVVTSFR